VSYPFMKDLTTHRKYLETHTTAKPELDFCVHLCELMNTVIKNNN